MDKSRKKELARQYKQMKPQMGIFIIRCNNNKCYIQATKDLRGVINGTKAKLQAGYHPCGELQKEWNELGSDAFTIEILEELEYEEDKTDYTDDLTLLQMMWEEKLTSKNMKFYKKRI